MKKLIQRLKRARQVLILTHTDPDGDALGTACLVKELLKKVNPQARAGILLDPNHKNELNYFIERMRINSIENPDTIISVDASNAERLYGLKDRQVDIMFDHHVGNSRFGKINIIDHKAASCTLVIYDICKKLNIKLTAVMAEMAYLGLSSDTGNFSFANTDERALEAAHQCTRAGVNPNFIYNKVNEQQTKREILDFARALQSVETHCDGKLITACIPAELKVDNRQLIDYIRREKTAEAALVLVAKKDHIKLSFRSKSKLNVAKIATKFNGGGHEKAAAGRISNTTLQKAKKQVVDYFKKNVF